MGFIVHLPTNSLKSIELAGKVPGRKFTEYGQAHKNVEIFSFIYFKETNFQVLSSQGCKGTPKSLLKS